MKVLKKAKSWDDTKTATCPCCGSELEFTSEDTWLDDNKVQRVMCPVCSYVFGVEDKFPVYPSAYYSYINGVDIKDDEINAWVKEAILSLGRDSYEHAYRYIASGNTIAFVRKEDEEYHIYVAKGYEEADYFEED